ncbi:MAG: tRNA (guanosine(37)-N1)-methyltransferase TrmD, partial [Nitrospirae bacterium]
MRCEVLTLFPELIEAVVSRSILKRAQEKGYVQIRARNIRDFCGDPHRTADDAPYGGGGGMVMKAEPIFRALEALRREYSRMRLIVPSPQGQPFSHDLAKDLSQESRPVVWLCGHYEGIDERVTIKFHPEEISIGDYVVTGGELPTLVMIDAAVRLIPGVLGHPTSAEEDSFAKTLLDYPHYTRPVRIEGLSVPSVLLSGNHEAIRRWRR